MEIQSEKLPCFKVPLDAESVLVSRESNYEGWKVEFKTVEGWKVLVKENDGGFVIFKSLDDLVYKLRGEGWVSSILLAEWQA